MERGLKDAVQFEVKVEKNKIYEQVRLDDTPPSMSDLSHLLNQSNPVTTLSVTCAQLVGEPLQPNEAPPA